MGRGRPTPTRVEDFEPEAEELVSRFERAEIVIGTILAGLAVASTPKALADAAKLILDIEAALFSACVAYARLQIAPIYLAGMSNAVESMKILEGPTQDELREQVARMARSSEHRQTVELETSGLQDDLTNATANMSRDAKGVLREIAARRIREALNQGNPIGEVAEFRREIEEREEEIPEVQKVRERGVRFIDRSGREWKPSRYARMVLLTATADTLNVGHINTAIELGSPGVAVSDGGPTDNDQPCLDANGQTWSLAYASQNRIEHPNCRRAFAALPRSFSGRLDRE